MLLTTILNQCYRFKGFVYAQARLVRQHGQQTIEVQVSGQGALRVCPRHQSEMLT